MKTLIVIAAAMIAIISSAFTEPMLTAMDAGISVSFPDNWIQDNGDPLRPIIRPEDGNNKRLQIHFIRYKGIPNGQEVPVLFEQEDKQEQEYVSSSRKFFMKSGIDARVAEIFEQGSSPPIEFTRIYFRNSVRRIVAIDIYHCMDANFAVEAQKAIRDSLTLTK